SEFTLSKFKEKRYFEKISTTIIPNAIQLDLEITKRLITEKKSNIQHNKTIFLFVGSIIEKKGIFHLVESFCRQYKNDTNISLHIAGEGAEVSRLLNAIEGHSNIVYHGSLEKSDLESLYQRSDFLVVPSMWEEPFGRVIIEAAANALPVIVSNQGGMPEIVNELGCGEIFSFDKKDNLEVTLLEMSKKKNYEGYLENIKHNIEKYSLQKQVVSFLEVYNYLLDM
ncbi:TPA: glycosyltransferase, partial [Streptococcus suis]